MPQSYFIVPVPDSGRPDQGLPQPPLIPGYPLPQPPLVPGYPLPVPPVDPGWGGGWGGGNRPDNSLPYPPVRPDNSLPPYPVDPGWGVGGPGGVRHPLLWLLPWLIKPATTAVPTPPPGDKPDPSKTYTKVLVAFGPGNFKWAWFAEEPVVTPPA